MRVYTEEQILEHIAAHVGEWYLADGKLIRRKNGDGARLCPLGSLSFDSYGPEAEVIEDDVTPLEYQIMAAADDNFAAADLITDHLRRRMLREAGLSLVGGAK